MFRQNLNTILFKQGLLIGILPRPIDCIKVDVSTVGQYTGLKDENGKKIFEGDVLACGDSKVPSQILWNEKWGGWAVKNLKRNEFHRLDIHFNRYIGEIIGNIYDNPELLE